MAKMIDRIRGKLNEVVAVALPGFGQIAVRVVSVDDDEIVTLLPEDPEKPRIVLHYTQFVILLSRS